MMTTQQMNSMALRTFGWVVAAVLLVTGVWLGIVLPLFAMAFGQIMPGAIALIAGIGIIVALRRIRTA
ncbi:hypothetical protein ACX80E_07745 [Arthrobacter sp. TMN-49]